MHFIFELGEVDTGINQVANGTLDLLVGPISITPERLKKVAFTQPYYSSYLARTRSQPFP
jgi:polar amino acid transport system substrate-binding protein